MIEMAKKQNGMNGNLCDEIPHPPKFDKIAQYILREHNWICLLVLVPISLVYDLFSTSKCIYQKKQNINSNIIVTFNDLNIICHLHMLIQTKISS